jgi:hypothetical protein
MEPIPHWMVSVALILEGGLCFALGWLFCMLKNDSKSFVDGYRKGFREARQMQEQIDAIRDD